MSKVVLTQEIAEQFAGALLAVMRSDREIKPSEGRAVQDVVAALIEGVTIDFAEVMLLTVTPDSFASAVRGARGFAYRGPSVSPPQAIAKAFSVAAHLSLARTALSILTRWRY